VVAEDEMPEAPQRSDLALAIAEMPLVDTHEHLASEEAWLAEEADVLQDLFWPYYAGADLHVAGATAEALRCSVGFAPSAVDGVVSFDPGDADLEARFARIEEAWRAMRHTGYGEAVRLLAREVYGLDELTASGLRDAQSHLEKLRGPGERLRLLRDVAKLDHVQIDSERWAIEADPDAPEFFLHDISVGRFCAGDLDLRAIHRPTGIEVASLEDLREALTAIFNRFGPTAIAVKAAHAYERTLRWEERADDEAARALAAVLAGGGEADPASRLAIGDWCWARCVELAVEHDLPFKVHTGTYACTGSLGIERVRAGNLCGLLARYPEARFVLMHIAYPYGDELTAIAKHFPNVWVDLCWAWALDPRSAGEFVRGFIHAVPSSKLFAFGGDTQWPTNALAFSLQARRWLTRALAAEVAAGDLTEAEAIELAGRFMYSNQHACFDVEGTRAAATASLAARGPFRTSP
jgi:uncharacterized protein